MMRIALITLVAFAMLILAGWIGTRFMDGPLGPIAGGPFRSGELIAASNPDWVAALGGNAMGEVELQLEDPVGSRITAAFVHEGELYIPCDLGFIWRRAPSPVLRGVLHLIWLLKHWHEDAAADGRVVVRIGDRRYEREAVRVTDPSLEAQFRDRMAEGAAQAFGELLPIETDPADIWFFRLDPRPKLDNVAL